MEVKKIKPVVKMIRNKFSTVDYKKGVAAMTSTPESARQFVDSDSKDIQVRTLYASIIALTDEPAFQNLLRAAYTRDIEIRPETWETLHRAYRELAKAQELFVEDAAEEGKVQEG